MGFTLTISTEDDNLIRRLRNEADRRRLPVEVVAEEWLRRAANPPRDVAGSMAQAELQQKLAALKPMSEEERRAFLELGGQWSAQEADEFDRHIVETFGQIDEELWK